MRFQGPGLTRLLYGRTPADGVPYWDTGAPELYRLGEGMLELPADPFNPHEPVDSSAAAFACQGLLRLGSYLGEAGQRYTQAGLTVLRALLEEPYLGPTRPAPAFRVPPANGWDNVPAGQDVPCGESRMWGDYHAREAALYIQRAAGNDPELVFFVK